MKLGEKARHTIEDRVYDVERQLWLTEVHLNSASLEAYRSGHEDLYQAIEALRLQITERWAAVKARNPVREIDPNSEAPYAAGK